MATPGLANQSSGGQRQKVEPGLDVSGLLPDLIVLPPSVMGNRQSQQISVAGLIIFPEQGVILAGDDRLMRQPKTKINCLIIRLKRAGIG